MGLKSGFVQLFPDSRLICCVVAQAHPESKLQEAALFVAGNLVWRGEAGAAARQARLADLGVLRALKLLRARHDAAHLHDKSVHVMYNNLVGN